jgi:hypothetical protein
MGERLDRLKEFERMKILHVILDCWGRHDFTYRNAVHVEMLLHSICCPPSTSTSTMSLSAKHAHICAMGAQCANEWMSRGGEGKMRYCTSGSK